MEQLNYFRASYIAFNLIPAGLRTVFKQEWDFLYKATASGEWEDTPKNGLDFYNNESRINHKRYGRLLAIIQRGNTAEWDCTCLFFAILYSDTIGKTLSPGIMKEVDDLREVRNAIAHKNDAELIDSEFQNYVARVLAAFTSLKLPINEVDDIKNQTDFPTAELSALKLQADSLRDDLQTKEQEAKNLTSELQTKKEEVDTLTQEISSKVQSFVDLTFKPSHPIIRRSNDVTRIMKKLDELQNESKGAISTVYLSGIPGCGKSQIARQLGQEVYEKKLRESKDLTFVATLNAESLDSLADSYSRLAKKVGITEYTLTSLENSTKGNPKEQVQCLKRLICPKAKKFPNWLIIVDNVADLSMVRKDLPPTGSEEWGHGQVLITTQDSSSIPSNAPLTYHESLSRGMHPDDALNLLQQVSQIQNQEQAEKVAEVLEYQPLALAAAAFYVQTVRDNGSPNYSWTNYLERLSQGGREAAEKVLANENTAYSKTTTSAVRMAITSALESDAVLRQVFCLFSLCAPESLPMEIAVDFVKLRGTLKIDELIRAKCFKSSLFSCLCDEEGTGTFIRMHNIVHEVLKSIMTFEMDRLQCFSVAIESFHSYMETNKNLMRSSRRVFAKLRMTANHCNVLHEILSSCFGRSNSEIILRAITPAKLISWLSLAADVCCDLSNPSQAYTFSSSGCNFVNFLNDSPKDQLLTACTYSTQGNVYRNLGQYRKAKEYHEKALTIRNNIYDEHHGEVAASLNNLGTVHRILGQYIQAKEYYEKALKIRKEIFGENHGDVAASYNNLGCVCDQLDQYSQATKYYEKALAIRKEMYGETHVDVAASYFNLGRVHKDLGQYSQAKDYHDKALSIRQEICGKLHADVAASYNSLGIVYSNLCQYHEAKEYYEMALIIRKEIYGEHHSDVAESYNNLATLNSELGQTWQAKKYHEKALTLNKKIYGEHHGYVAAGYYSLGIVYSDLCQYGDAKEYYEKSLTIKKEIYGEYHGDVAANYNSLGNANLRLCQYREAKICFERALVITRKIYGGRNGPEVAKSYDNLGSVYRNICQYSEAKEYHEKSLSVKKIICGEEHSSVANSYFDLGNIYCSVKQYPVSEECYEKALNIYKTLYGEQHALVKRTCNELGFVKRKQRELKQTRNKCCIV